MPDNQPQSQNQPQPQPQSQPVAPMQPPPLPQAYVPQPPAPAGPAAPAPAPVYTTTDTRNYMGESFKMLITDPVGNLKRAYDNMGMGRAMGLGVILSVVFGISFVWVVATGRGSVVGGYGYGWGGSSTSLDPKDALYVVLVGAVIVFGLSIGSLVCRSMSAGGGAFAQDIFVAGLALLPMCPCLFVASHYWAEYPAVGVGALMFGGCLLVLSYYAAGTDLHGMSRRASSIMTPLVIMITSAVAYMMYTALLGAPSWAAH